MMQFPVLSVLLSFRISFSAKKPVALCYWYSAWRRERAARRTRVKSGTVVTTDAGLLAVVMVAPGDDGGTRRLAAW